MPPTPKAPATRSRSVRRWLGVAALAVIAATAHAGDKGYLSPAPAGEGFHFSHGNWELACDNTRTCRAAGYHADSDELKVSVLLTRAAGPGTPVEAVMAIGQYGDEPVIDALPEVVSMTLFIDGTPVEQLSLKKDALGATLSEQAVNALVKALGKRSVIEWVHGKHRWRLSDRGAIAVLLKMDEFQGRIGTPGALLRKGTKNEQSVRLPLPVPTFLIPVLPTPKQGDDTFVKRYAADLLQALRQDKDAEETDCYFLQEATTESADFDTERLSPTQMLITTRCWLAAYNWGQGFWVVNDQPPFQPQLVTSSASHGDREELTESHKGRGLGDCRSVSTMSWNGKQFVPTQQSTTGMCKLMAPGGAWELPTLVTDVQRTR